MTREERRRRWESYLALRLMDERLPIAQRNCLGATWQRVLTAEPTVLYPSSGMDEQSGGVYLSWTGPDKMLDVEIRPDGQIEWFYADHASRVDADGEAEGFLPYLKHFTTS